MELICFFHPRVKGTNASDECDVCRRPFNLPSEQPPRDIGEYAVEGVLGRGFYSVAYRVRNQRTGIPSVMKVTPKSVYDLPHPQDSTAGGFGDRRDFLRECQLHHQLREIPEIASIADWGEATVSIGDIYLDVCWVRMEEVQGETIEHYFEPGSPLLRPREIAQIAQDLLHLSEKLQAHHVYHNDLHGGNAIVVRLPIERHRKRAIDPTIAVKAFDLGSASYDDKADVSSARLGDLEQISLQMFRLLDRFDDESLSQTIIPSDVRLSAQLRKVAQVFAQADMQSRRATASDMLSEVKTAYELAVHPETLRPIEFHSIQDHYNSQTLPPEFARHLMHDPNEQWTRAITSAGPQLIVGMRGCGKTMLLRSLEWPAQAAAGPGETSQQVLDRVTRQGYLGLFVSCAHLLRAPRERVGAGALQRLYLAYAREAIRAVQICEVQELGESQPNAIDSFFELVSTTVPTIDLDRYTTSPPNIELALTKAIAREVPDDIRRSFVPLEAFTELSNRICSMMDIWKEKTVLYLLDDVSKRFVSDEDLTDLLAQFCLKSEHFGFKVSTETQTQVLHSPSGDTAQQGRDYQVFDLGAEVLEALNGIRGVDFLGEILDRRQKAVSGMGAARAGERLGYRRLESIAADIRSGSKSPYAGLNALAAICVGDIGDVLQIYHKMTQDVQPHERVPSKRQNTVLVDACRWRLLSLVKLDVDYPWHYLHSAAFSNASKRELVSDKERIRQYSDVYVEIDSSDENAFSDIMDLVDHGVYVIRGFRQRSKDKLDSPPIYQFALRFRKLLGLERNIPLANRDRFELSGAAAAAWLKNPSSDLLTEAGEDSEFAAELGRWMTVQDEEEAEEPEGPGAGAIPQPLTLFPVEAGGESRSPGSEAIRTSLKVEINELPLEPDTLGTDWSSAILISGLGFEDRSPGSLLAMVAKGIPPLARSVLVRYPTKGKRRDSIEAARQISQDITFMEVDPEEDPSGPICDLVDSWSDSEGPVVLNVSSLTKPLIYSFTKEILRARGKLYVSHTSAESYHPKSNELQPVLRYLDQGELSNGLKLLDEITPGEGTEFKPVSIGEPWLDASLRSLLVAFVTLKYGRLDSILESVSTDKIVGVRALHSSAGKVLVNKAIEMVGNYQIRTQNGELVGVSAMDAAATYDLLMSYYTQYVLDGAYRIQLALTGTKMQTVGMGAFASVARVANALYAVPLNRDTSRFTEGVGKTRFFELSASPAM